MRQFLAELRPTSDTTILDVGGSPATWRGIGARPQITVLNTHPIDYTQDPADPPMRTVVGDGCRLEFADKSFDIVFSNSVIEHLGTLDNQRRFASECRRVADRLWVQTPARSFFIESHLLTPFVHFLPQGAQRKLIRNFTLWGLLARPTKNQVDGFLREVRLLDRREMEAQFPDCQIVAERVMGLTKSYIAVRDSATTQSPGSR